MKSATKGHGGTSMSRTAALGATALLAAVLPAGAAAADDHETVDHGHIMLIGVELAPGTFPPVPVSVRNCVELANGRALPAHSHHAHLHRAPDESVGRHNFVLPTQPYVDPVLGPVPFVDCDQTLALFGLD